MVWLPPFGNFEVSQSALRNGKLKVNVQLDDFVASADDVEFETLVQFDDLNKIVADLAPSVGRDVRRAFWAVYDGFGGQSSSLWLKSHLHEHLVRRELRRFYFDHLGHLAEARARRAGDEGIVARRHGPQFQRARLRGHERQQG